jgi:hypothetical protein
MLMSGICLDGARVLFNWFRSEVAMLYDALTPLNGVRAGE